MSSNRFRSDIHQFSINLPYGWRVERGPLARVTNWFQQLEASLSPRGKRYPRVGIHVRETRMSTNDDIRKLMLDVARSLRATVLSHGPVTIGGRDGYSVDYQQRNRPGAIQSRKAAIILRGKYYLFQFSSDDLDEDKTAIEQFLASIAFDP